MTTSPFDYVKSINETKVNMMRNTENDELAEKDYNPFIVNKSLSFFLDTVLHANEMNMHAELDNRVQYEYLINSIRPKKRWSKWFKEEKSEDLDIICTHYNCSKSKGREYLSLLTKEQIQIMKKEQEKGGR